MKKKKIFIGTIISCVMLALSACGSSDNVVTSKVWNVTEKELSKELRQQYGESTLY
ncbi:peptidylprolyl isomerase, partial [Klebsiella pneumoniae]|nr:peptidylprolyl isomerase [Klebsiella pneumoniae]